MIDPHHRRILPRSVTLSKLSWGQYLPEIWAGLFRADRMRETFIIPTHIVLTHCLCVCPCLSTTGLNPSMPDITGVWKCVGACALEERCVCHVSANTAANTPTKPSVFSNLIFHPVKPDSYVTEWRRRARRKKTRVKQEERSWKMLIKKLQSTLTVL